MNLRSKLAFSTLGCPGDAIEKVVEIARATGAGAVELRCFPGEPVSPTSSQADLRIVRNALSDAAVSVVCVASYIEVGALADPIDNLLWHVEAARELSSPFVRVFGCAESMSGARDRAVDRLRAGSEAIAGSGVSILLETHDAFLSGAAVADVLQAVGSPNVGAIWDVVNPWRTGESPRDTLDHLSPWLKHVQLKDIASPGELTPVLPGAGTVPLSEILLLLDDAKYDGWLSLEWERAWHPEIPSLVAALAQMAPLLEGHPSVADTSRVGRISGDGFR